jgi:hypothetical protein
MYPKAVEIARLVLGFERDHKILFVSSGDDGDELCFQQDGLDYRFSRPDPHHLKYTIYGLGSMSSRIVGERIFADDPLQLPTREQLAAVADKVLWMHDPSKPQYLVYALIDESEVKWYCGRWAVVYTGGRPMFESRHDQREIQLSDLMDEKGYPRV